MAAVIELLTEDDKKNEKWITENYSEVTQKVVNTFVFLCRFHAEQKPITTRVKPMVSPLQAETFLSLIEVDLMPYGFQKLPM